MTYRFSRCLRPFRRGHASQKTSGFLLPLVGMHKTCQFLGPGININQDETSEESEIKENSIHLMKHFGVLGRMTQLLRHRQNVSFFPPFDSVHNRLII